MHLFGKKLTVEVSLLSILVINMSHATQPTSICHRLPGNWFGSYTFKHKTDCDKAKGCTHGISVAVDQTADKNYHANAKDSCGNNTQYELECTDDKIAFLGNHQGALTVSCEKTHLCTAQYDDDAVYATVINVKNTDR